MLLPARFTGLLGWCLIYVDLMRLHNENPTDFCIEIQQAPAIFPPADILKITVSTAPLVGC